MYTQEKPCNQLESEQSMSQTGQYYKVNAIVHVKRFCVGSILTKEETKLGRKENIQ